MRPLATAADSFDRISTPEELKLVVELLIDLDGPGDMDLFHALQPASSSRPEAQDMSERIDAQDDPSALSDSAALATLFSRMHGRTN